MQLLPQHLQKYIVEQNYQKYTALDHAVWRYILRQLKNYLSKHAHSSYLSGLEKTGIEVEYIPRIEDISAKLEKFGWRALPVSGFIPPAAFMELQSLSVLPIASDMRSMEHLLYTPAPDIVHEAAGHAPIIADPEYAAYLKEYAQIAKKAIISKEDLDLYKAIRELSDIKENPNSNPQQIAEAEAELERVSESMSFVSEATELSRMNWWTAEYGLIGDIKSPKIFGAGLLSSVGESQWCLSEKVKKIPLSVNCIQQTYDITEPQPQLFVADSFKHLSTVLKDLSSTMAFNLGGIKGLKKALQAETVNTVEFENKLQISGKLQKIIQTKNSEVAYLQFNGPTQISYEAKQVSGHDKNYHVHGYGTPVGTFKNTNVDELEVHQSLSLEYTSGVNVTGILKAKTSLSNNAFILTFENANCWFDSQHLFKPEWGLYDIIVANEVTSVFGGPADRIAYGETDDFVASRVAEPQYTTEQISLFSFYQQVRDLRQAPEKQVSQIEYLFEQIKIQYPDEWLLFIELLEMTLKNKKDENLSKKIEQFLNNLSEKNVKTQDLISEGIKLAHAKF
jgi:phenylalanine-4-hydroxylase